MKKDINQVLKEKFDKEFSNNQKMADAERKQQCFWVLTKHDLLNGSIKKVIVAQN